MPSTRADTRHDGEATADSYYKGSFLTDKTLYMMKSASGSFALLLAAISFLAATTAFAPMPIVSQQSAKSNRAGTHLNIFDEKERQELTRDSEPDDFFQT